MRVIQSPLLKDGHVLLVSRDTSLCGIHVTLEALQVLFMAL